MFHLVKNMWNETELRERAAEEWIQLDEDVQNLPFRQLYSEFKQHLVEKYHLPAKVTLLVAYDMAKKLNEEEIVLTPKSIPPESVRVWLEALFRMSTKKAEPIFKESLDTIYKAWVGGLLTYEKQAAATATVMTEREKYSYLVRDVLEHKRLNPSTSLVSLRDWQQAFDEIHSRTCAARRAADSATYYRMTPAEKEKLETHCNKPGTSCDLPCKKFNKKCNPKAKWF